jgi:outer membrane receptor protein involved in Fe transport
MQKPQFAGIQQCFSGQGRRVKVLTISRLGDIYLQSFLLTMLLAAMVWAFPGSLAAQNSYGTVVGAVSDSAGATIVGAKVILTNQGTNVAVTAKSGATGNYTFPNLNPDQYRLRVESKGFKTYEQDAIDVQIGGTVRLDASLSVGEQSETVVVTGAPPDLQTDSAELGGVVEEEQIENTPLNGRNVNNLLTLVPGVVAGGGTSGNTTANFASGAMTQPIAYGNYQIGGGFSGQSSFYVDGAQVNVPENNVDGLVPTQDAVQEFRVSTNNVSAEFGGFAGGVINIGTKSGTNEFHGSAYEYARNTVFDANDWFSNHDNLNRTPLHQNQFGLNAGGPIRRKKTFAFFSWEHERVTSQTPAIYTIPNTAELNGDFSAVAATNPIYDLSTAGDPQFSCNGTANVICPNRIDPSAQAIIKAIYPATTQVGQNNYAVSSKTSGSQDEYNARIDHHFSEKNTLFGRYTYWDPTSGPNDPWQNKTGLAGTSNVTHQVVLGDTHVISPTLVADVRLSYFRNVGMEETSTYGRDMSPFGSAYSALQSQFHMGVLPQVNLQGYSSTNGDLFLDWINNIYTISPSLTKIAGHHTIKIGATVRQVAWTTEPAPGADVGFTTNPAFTALSSNAASGNALASFLLGLPQTSTNSQIGGTHGFFHNYGFYVTDTYQVTPKLTANLGLRWDQPSAYSEKDNDLSVFLPNAPSPLGTISNPATGGSQTLAGNLALVDSPAYPSRRMENLHWDIFDPRFGLAYRANDKTVVRLGYGISHLPSSMSQDGPDLSPINTNSTTLTNSVVNNVINTPETTVANPFPTGLILPPLRSAGGTDTLLGQTISGTVPDNASAYVQQYNLTLERTIDSKTTASLSYAGAKGTHLFLAGAGTYSTRNLNQLPDKYFSMGGALMAPVANPFYGKIASGPLSGPTTMMGYLLSPYPQYQAVNKRSPREGGSTYNALQASLNHKFGNGGILGMAYTWSKLLSNTDSVSSFMDTADWGLVGMVQDNNNLKAEKALSLQDFPMNLQISYSEELPIGAHQKYLNNTGKFVSPVISGWRMSGITTFRSGAPVAVEGAPTALSLFFGAGNTVIPFVRPNVVSGCNKSGSRSVQADGTIKWFNASCFTSADFFGLGNESRTDPKLRADGIKNFDFSLTKATSLSERVKLNFSAEFFNIFNRTQFGQPESFLTAGATFGEPSTQANNPRLMQFALRTSF